MDSAADADDGEEAAGLGALFAVAEEEIGAAGGAEIADEDILGTEAGGKELGAIGFFQVEEDVFGRGLVAGGHHVQPWTGLGSSPVRNSSNHSGASANWERNWVATSVPTS